MNGTERTIAGNIVTIETDNVGVLTAHNSSPGNFEAVDGLNINYGTIATLKSLGVTIAKGQVPANAVVPSHAGETHYALLVLSGTGELTLNLADGTETSRLSYKAGDLIIFPPNAYHGWINKGEDMEWLGVDIEPR